MKTVNLILILSFWSVALWGQTNFVDSTSWIQYNFQTGSYLKDIKRIKVHTPVVFEIRNINPFAYTVTVTPKDSVVARSSFDKELLEAITNSELQKGAEKLSATQVEVNSSVANQAPELVTADFKNGTDGKSKNQESFNKISEIVKLQEQSWELKEKLQSYQDSLNRIESHISKIGNDTTNAQSKDSAAIAKVKEMEEIRKAEYDTLQSEAKKRLTEIEYKTKKLQKEVNDALKTYESLLSTFIQKYDAFLIDSRYLLRMLRYTNSINAVADNPQLDYNLFKRQFKGDVDRMSAELFKSLNEIDNYKRSHSELADAYFRLIYTPALDSIMEPSGIAKAQAYPNFLKAKADGLSKWFADYAADNIIKQAIWVASILSDSTQYNFHSSPIQPENDLLQFEVKIAKRRPVHPNALYREKNFTYRQPLYGGTRVDFSLGLAASYYWNAPTYELDTESRITKAGPDHMVAPAVLGMVTMSRRRTGYIAWGGSAGLGLDINEGKIQLSNFFIGPTMLLGKSERIFLSLGASLKDVGRLKSGYEYTIGDKLGTEIPPTSDLSSYMAKHYRIGVFASITYSLTKDALAMIKNLR
ncbi:hypothetical protein SAMN05421747_104108 [Parapedobacter composti]|uniref:Outer membrane protein beta-barrel domain-containing protein n=1 Tax=Parapedobacter composti TaxID=623281 RepID=A0A1I1GC42_9SPHI|nr:hypothetical protein [Parapedobacter composti]SFC09307.1 hypothetical protein SAMN05421747_104108 [Parapedobacter composti]